MPTLRFFCLSCIAKLFFRLEAIYPGLNKDNLDFAHQAKMQLAGVAVTLGLSICGGLITGALLRISYLCDPKIRFLFDDSDIWLVRLFF